MTMPPYLDAHGEEDPYLKRGRPLHLCAERIAEVSRVWLSGSLDTSSFLSRSRLGAEFY